MEIFSNLFAQSIALSALSVVGIQQVMKLNIVPVAIANKYPVPTLIVLSIIAAIVTVLFTPIHPVVWQDWLVLIATIAVTAAITYNMTLRHWAELRAIEGDGKK